MAEPQPADIPEDAPTGTAEDRRAAAALSSLDTHDDASADKRDVDSEALGNAMKNLGGGKQKEAKKEVESKKVKIDMKDVSLLAEHLELSKPKVTELLKAHEGDAVRAMKAYVSTSA
ncbi:hypothetical protein EJ05DRAFT_488551 [Pseudovirgaria hyperparasitica]|uniref:Nascent polypeptide-associated complex subunit alpha-like UBA domain-containing protein n=1 Tax=Pseudovirgaria hyperparasitica TaxID=470096 RepID=A0A6A6VXS9_9PEZI|nr:uncharacterized protein EJ05DRAFT_488551 [Pseudovirgaria hyperparasitica]KAF2754985.1 hypothetical protein EJ05DRAFT_488551 [Pseudovirgaria hyperparasitica]